MATSTFYSPAQDEIVSDYLRDIGLEIPDAVTSDGSDYQRGGTVLAMTLLPIYRNGEILARESFPDTAISEKGLIRWSRVAGVPKQGAAYADGTATVSASISTTIPDGTFLKNAKTGIIYKTVGDTPIVAPATATAFLVATSAGEAGDADATTALDFVAVPPGVNPQATVISISGGGSAWSNAKWAAEILKALRARAGGGNVPQILQLCAAVAGVEGVFVYPALRSGGTLDVVITTSLASGSRVAGRSLLSKVSAALRFGVRAIGGDFVPGIPDDVFENTSVAPAVAQTTNITIGLTASLANPWGAWPASHANDALTWYTVVGSTGLGQMSVNPGASVAGAAPVVGAQIGIYFPSVGYVRAKVLSVTGPSPWTVTLSAWSTTPTETTIPTGSVISPWNTNLQKLIGPPAAGSIALSGAVYDYLASLGPGEMTALTPDDITRRCRWPRSSDTDPITGTVEWPTNIAGRLIAAIYDATDAQTVTTPTVSVSTPSVPAAAYIGTPPSILVPGTVVVLPN